MAATIVTKLIELGRRLRPRPLTGALSELPSAWLEWDRGTERIAVLLEKLDRYAAYYRSHTFSDGSVPQLLVVCPTPHREDVV